MHELNLTRTLFETTMRYAEKRQVKQVNLLIGEFSDEREDAIRFHWDELAKDSLAQGAQLNFQRVDAEMQCLACETVFHPKEEFVLCPACGSQRLKLLSGDDVRLASIDVE
jgi:hydrogenase nickel incorporation protein HypA/HybF